MRVVVIGITGRRVERIVGELLRRGHDVLGVNAAPSACPSCWAT